MNIYFQQFLIKSYDFHSLSVYTLQCCIVYAAFPITLCQYFITHVPSSDIINAINKPIVSLYTGPTYLVNRYFSVVDWTLLFPITTYI
jgi:hypothetical protein